MNITEQTYELLPSDFTDKPRKAGMPSMEEVINFFIDKGAQIITENDSYVKMSFRHSMYMGVYGTKVPKETVLNAGLQFLSKIYVTTKDR
jgi:hypothetical protein